ncbi:MAG TPA: TonB family protein [Gemmatimonadales bacterium]|nr:TonB family protein [Gemmatimonadales bacterium]
MALVFDTLIESKRKTEKKKFFGVGFVSLILHSGVVGAAIVATMSAGEAASKIVVDTNMVYLQQQTQKQPEPQPVQLDVQLKGFQTVVAPENIPTDIPPVNLQEHFDPKDYSGTGVEGGVATGITPSSDQVFMEAVVDEKPDRLSGPPLVYPELLRQAGIQGLVMVQAIVDTNGRAEPNSIKIVSSANPGFNDAARQLVLRSLYRPGRTMGRAVRVMIQQPVNFVIQR